MDSLISKVLGIYLKRFIKDYKEDMLKLQVLKGLGSMSNFELNGEVLQELLLVPTNLEIIEAKCDSLELKVPYTNLKKEPIVFSLGRVDVKLKEPDTIKPMPSILARVTKSQGVGGDSSKLRVMKTIQVEIKELHLTIETLGNNTFNPNWAPSLLIDVTDITLKTTNKDWKPVPLNEALFVDADKKREYLYKQATIGSISMSSRMVAGEEPTPIIKNLPCKQRFYTEFDTSINVWVASSLTMMFEEVNFVWDQSQWQRIADLVLSLQSCLRRPIPPNEADKDIEGGGIDLTTNKVSYGIQVSQWVIELLRGKKGGEDGWAFFGFGLDLDVSPERKTKYCVKDLGCREDDKFVQCWESIHNVSVTSVSFRERNPDPKKEPLYTRLVSQVIEGEQETKLLDLQFIRRNKIDDSDIKLKRQVPSIESNLNMVGLQLVYDKQAWKDLYTFVIEGPLESEVESKGSQLKSKVTEKKDLEEVDEMISELYFTNTKANIKALMTTLIIPNDPHSDKPELRTKSVLANAQSLSLTNRPDWPFPPFLKDALDALPGQRAELTPEEGTIHKFEGKLEGFKIELHDHPEEGDAKDPEVILNPCGVDVYGRYFPPDKTDKKSHKLEATVHGHSWRALVTKDQLTYAAKLIKDNKDWGVQVDKEEKERRKINKMMSAAASGVSEMKSTEMETEEKKIDAQAVVSKGVKYSLGNLQVTGFARLENAELKFPAPAAFGMISALGKSAEGEEQEETEQEELPPSRFAINLLELVGDNSIDSQAVVARFKSVDIEGLDHPQSPVSFALNTNADSRAKYAAEVTYHRKLAQADDENQEMSLKAGVQGLTITSVAKPPSTIKGLAEGINVNTIVSTVFSKFSSTADKRSEIVGKVKEGAKIAKAVTEDVLDSEIKDLAVNWDVNLSDCKVRYLQKYKSGEVKPIGEFKLASESKEEMGTALQEVENQLIAAKLKLAETQATNMDQDSAIAKLKAEVNTLSKAIADAKFEVATLSAENDELKTAVKKAQSQAAHPTPSSNTGGKTSGRVRGFL